MEIGEIKFIKSIIEDEIDTERSPVSQVNNKFRLLFIWRSNVGKSSMINSLLWKKDLAFSSSKAWKTRTINIFSVNTKYECLDFPWYWFARQGKSEQTKFRDMILNFLQNSIWKNVKIVMIIDALVWPTSQDQEVFDYLNIKWANILIILNKVDKTTQKILQETKNIVERDFPQTSYIYYSCRNKKYKDFALNEIFKF